MSGRGNATLQEQMARLQKSMSHRDERRQRDADKRQMGAEDDPYSDRVAKKPNTTDGEKYNAAAAAMAAVAQASALEGPSLIRCDVCNATFGVDAAMQQHLAGPTHKKALAKAKAEQIRNDSLGNNRWAAENASAAAGWQVSSSKYEYAKRPMAEAGATPAGSLPAVARPPPSNPRQKDKLGQKPLGKAIAARLPAPGPLRSTLSHAALVAAAKVDDGPLSIGGWVPPSVGLITGAFGSGRLSSAPESGGAEASSSESDDSDEDDADGVGVSAVAAENNSRKGKPKGSAVGADDDIEDASGGGLLVGYGSSSDSGSSSDDANDAERTNDGPVSFF